MRPKNVRYITPATAKSLALLPAKSGSEHHNQESTAIRTTSSVLTILWFCEVLLVKDKFELPWNCSASGLPRNSRQLIGWTE